MIKILQAPSFSLAQTVNAHVSVEAEYGSEIKEGSILTLAHHQASGPYSSANSPSPCNNGAAVDAALPELKAALDADGEIVVVVSHIDLDTIGGCLRVMAALTDLPADKKLFDLQSFWSLAEFVDLNGAHKRLEAGAGDEDLATLDAYWAFSDAHRERPPQETTSITDKVLAHSQALRSIFSGDKDMLAAGEKFRSDEDKLNKESLVEVVDDVVVRVANTFTNHLYTPVDGQSHKAVVALDTKAESVTVSLADSIEGVSCREIVQELWGPEAGGHDGIAGSPRETKMGHDDLIVARDAMIKALS